MIDLAGIVQRHGRRTLFLSEQEHVSYSQFLEMVDAAGPDRAGHSCAGLSAHPLEWTAASFARLLAQLRSGGSVFLGAGPPPGDLAPFLPHQPLLVLRTGGTTGRPRHVVHAVDRLLAGYTVQERPPTRVLVLYAADHIAGLDAFFQALHRGSTLVVPAGRDPQSVAHALEHYQVQVVPATPTFLHFLLLSGALDGRKLGCVEAIPHGAEPMPDAVRQRLKVVFPKARLIHRFGLTELGALPVEADPADPDALFLKASGHAWEIRDGELWIKSPARMLGTLEDGPVAGDAWHPTGDLAEATPRGSVRILGRRAALINVGGEKVVPEIVEDLLLAQPGVRDAAVYGVANPLTGQAVAARVVFAGEPDTLGLLRALRVAARARGLGLAHVPMRIEAVDALEKTAIGKRSRPLGKA